MARRFTVSGKIEAEDKATPVAKKAQGGFRGLGNVLSKNVAVAAGLVAAAFVIVTKALKAVVNAIGNAIDAANKQERALALLANSTKQFGLEASAVTDRLAEYASELQTVSTFGDELIIQQQSLLASFGLTEQQIKDASKAAVELASTGIVSLDSATRNIGKTFGGLAGELGELIPQIRDLTQEELRSGAALQVIINQFGGSAAANISTFGGKVEQLSNALGDVTENLGGLITQNRLAKAVVDALTESIVAFNSLLPTVERNQSRLEKIQSDLNKINSEATRIQEFLTAAREEDGRRLRVFIDLLGKGATTAEAMAIAEGRLNELSERRATLLGKESKEQARLNKLKRQAATADEKLVAAEERLGVVSEALIRVQLKEARQAFKTLKDAAIEGKIGVDELTAAEENLRREEVRLRQALRDSNGDLETFEAILSQTDSTTLKLVDSFSALGSESDVVFDKTTRAATGLQAMKQGADLVRASLGNLSNQIARTSSDFDRLTQQSGLDAAIRAALAGGARLSSDGRRIIFPGGGSRFTFEAGGGGGFGVGSFELFPERIRSGD